MSETAAKPSLDPDVLAALERERDFLLRSLDDLDAERAAGDLDTSDHAALADDYTRRLAEVARSIDEERTAFDQVDTKLDIRQRVFTVIGIVVLAVLAGVLLGQASGFRSPEDSVTGDIRQSSAGLLAEADTLTREQRWPEAIEVYDEVLDVAPGNVEALTYRGWLTARLGDDETALLDLREAVAVDPTYPDARVFSAIVLDNQLRFTEAAAELAAFDSLDPPEDMLMLVEQFDLRVSVAAGQINQVFSPLEPGETVDLSQIDASLDVIARAGARLSQLGDIVLAQATFSAVLAEDPEQLIALVGKGQLARQAEITELNPELASEAMQALDEAVRLATSQDEPVIRLYRADARLAQGDDDGALEDLEAVDRDVLSPDLQALYDQLARSLN
ncbi:tetratricopeptide repeat protein [bacterium]|nr:tetratricopeptide repeat protein [bacterium]MDA9359934.1 tetratricopeptide repeat protein [bacterium]MDC0349406.1 tetratricopeptide repeat protein [bacterium]MDC3300263.1 tetratricopeptide repeat protein [Acidimicrobiales bacterium]